MKKNYNYPIKYAIMPIKEQDGWDHGFNELERRYETVTNIVSKCYVISETKFYNENNEIKYEIVFPLQKETSRAYLDYERVEPEYNFYDQCINSVYVSQLFDTYEEAQNAANNANKEIYDGLIHFLSFDNFIEKIEKLKKKQQEIIDRYKPLQERIKKETIDLKVENNSNIEQIIENIIDNPRKFYTQIANFLTLEEREYLRELILDKNCNNCSNGICNIQTAKKDDVCAFWNNKELIGKQKLFKR